MNVRLLICVALAGFCVACNNSSTSKYEGGYNTDNERIENNEKDTRTQQVNPKMANCPWCGGCGTVKLPDPGEIGMMLGYQGGTQVCQACAGQGKVPTEIAEMMKQAVSGMMNGSGMGNGNSGHSGRSKTQIQTELIKAKEVLQSIERDYSNCSSDVLRMQYAQMISNQRGYISRLEDELRYAN